jgi:cbb3-type cytochrome oxidase subunit 3
MLARPISGITLAASLLGLAAMFYLGLIGPLWSDPELYYVYSRNFFSGADSGLFLSLYPPFALAYFLFPALFSSNLTGYLGKFEALNILLFAVTACLVYFFAGKRGLEPRETAVKYAALVLPLTNMFLWRYDLLPALLAFAAVILFLGGRRSLGFSALLVAGGLKLFPLLLLPFFFFAYRKKDRRVLAKDFLPPAAVIALLYFWAAQALSYGRGLVDPLFYNLGRYFQIESVYSSVILAAGALVPSLRPDVAVSLSADIRFPYESALLWLPSVLMAVALLAVYWSAYRSRKTLERDLPAWCALALLAFLVTTKVFSTQYVLWLAPFLPFVLPKEWKFFALCASVFLLTALVCPYLYRSLLAQNPFAIVVLLLRNVVLLAVFFKLARVLNISVPKFGK